MAEVDYIKSINEKITNIEKKLENVQDVSFVVKQTVSYQLNKIKKIKDLTTKKIKSFKDDIFKLYKAHKLKINNILKSSVFAIKENKCVKMFLNTIKTTFNSSKKLISGIKTKFIGLIKNTFSIVSSIGYYFIEKMASITNIVDKLLFGIPGKIWNSVKFALIT
jgi:replicative superfamily II helicase